MRASFTRRTRGRRRGPSTVAPLPYAGDDGGKVKLRAQLVVVGDVPRPRPPIYSVVQAWIEQEEGGGGLEPAAAPAVHYCVPARQQTAPRPENRGRGRADARRRREGRGHA
ncbi:hypothetical protein PG994_001055 [Apiospora phragmitis]|uniref:Uncharacterized protein n=1 Tax=Apiospora phragmitis TaxID=2905665 RepID=A0ABR1WSF8_9PEZI